MTNDDTEKDEEDPEKKANKIQEKDELNSKSKELKLNEDDSGMYRNELFYADEVNNKPVESTKHFYEELFDNYGDNEPYDLSLKPKREKENDLKPESVDYESSKPIESTPQNDFFTHLSKIQQHFVSNLIQYQASILTHFQQLQQQSLQHSKEVKEEDEANDPVYSNDLPLPQFFNTSNLLSNLVPFSLYSNLLPVTQQLSSSKCLENDNSTSSLSPEPLNEETSKEELPTSHLVQIKTESNSSLIGASINNSSSKSPDNNEYEDADNGSSNFHYKRKRIAFSAKQYELLQTTFEHNNFPEPGDQQCIANQLKAPYRSIKMWFQNKRANARKKLVPGEKGSGRTATGDKIPGDTDTRFYCDKCPSAFICQKYLNNHDSSHALYTKNCPNCNVIFTHDCLLTTHLLTKCANVSNKETKPTLDNVDTSSQPLNLATKNSSKRKLEEDEENEKEEGNNNNVNIASSLLSHLGSSLPLLTLLQIQKKQEQQRKLEESYKSSFDPENEVHSSIETSDNEEMNYDAIEYPDKNKVKLRAAKPCSNKKKIPDLIPADPLTDPVNSKFVLLRHLLTNFSKNHSNTQDKDDEQFEDIADSNEIEKSIKQEDDLFSSSVENNKGNLPKNIPEHLYVLLKGNKRTAIKTENLTDNEMEEEENFPDTHKKIKTEKRKWDNMEMDLSENETSASSKFVRKPKAKRLRRRTTVFTEAQHRILYLHFTHCNFPDPSMFRILSKLTGLTPHVIKIWFQNERSRQRRQVTITEGEVSGTKEKKPYKCRDCGVEFAMPAFLVKHCMRHIPTDNVTSQARKCPICMVEFETQKLHSHFMASHNLSINMDEDGNNEKNICHLCQEQFSDLNTLSNHKFEHIKDTQYGEPPQCSECKTTFVNVLCLEAHMATHQKFEWNHSCEKCKMNFYDKTLLESHHLSHSLSSASSSSLAATCIASSTASPSENVSSPSAINPQNTDSSSNNQYFVSLLQQLTDSKHHKLIKPKTCESEDLKTEDIFNGNNKASVSISKINGYQQQQQSISPSSKNISFKVIPVKLIPVSSSEASSKTSSNNVSISISESNNMGTKHQVSNSNQSILTLISPSQFVAVKEKNNLSPDMQKEGKISLVKNSSIESPMKKVKKVPNLIPISDVSSFPFGQPIQNIGSPNKELSDSSSMNSEISSGSAKDSQSSLYTPYASEYRKRRRTPTHFNGAQRDILEAYYKYDNFPDPNEQLHLSEYLNVPYSVIKTWFQNTRKNHRKHLKESSSTDVSGPFECSLCRVCFVSKIYIDSHLKQHSEDSLIYKCTGCKLQFPHQAIYDIHKTMGCAAKKSKKKLDHVRPLSSPSNDSEFFNNHHDENTSLASIRRELGASSNDSSRVKIISMEFEEEKEDNLEKTPLKISVDKIIVSNSNTCPSVLLNGSPTSNALSSLGGQQTTFIYTETCNECPKCLVKFASAKMLDLHLQSERDCSKLTSEDGQDQGFNPVTNYIPQIIGYTCPDCNETFQSFISIAEHKFQSDCQRRKDGENLIDTDANLPEDSESISTSTTRYDSSLQISISSVSKSAGTNLTIPVPQMSFLSDTTKVEKPLKMSEMLDLYSTINGNNFKETTKSREKSSKTKLNLLEYEVKFLNFHYSFNNFPSSKEVEILSKRFKVEEKKLSLWFERQRSKERKEACKEDFGPPIQCNDCPSLFVTSEGLRLHEVESHNENASFKCPEVNCNAKFLSTILLDTHQMLHEEEKSDMSNSKTNGLNRHCSFLEAHYSENNFPSQTDIKFIAKRLNFNYMGILWWFKERRAKHVLDMEKRMKILCQGDIKIKVLSTTKQCDVCTATFLDETEYEKHLQVHFSHSALVCMICGSEFTSPLVLKTHLFLHGITEFPNNFISHVENIKIDSSLKFKYSFLQLQVLFSHYKHNNFPKKPEMKALSDFLKIPMKRVISWFRFQRQAPILQTCTNNKASISNGVENQNNTRSVNCSECLAEFMSKQHMKFHTELHKKAKKFTCNGCESEDFLHEMIRDCHSLTHLTCVEWKTKRKVLFKSMKIFLEKVMKESGGDVGLASTYTEVHVPSSNLQESPEEVNYTCNDDEQKNGDQHTLSGMNLIISSNNEIDGQSLASNHSRDAVVESSEDKSELIQDLQVSHNNEDSASDEEEDDDMKLVIDE